jgi:hypothetical protein
MNLLQYKYKRYFQTIVTTALLLFLFTTIPISETVHAGNFPLQHSKDRQAIVKNLYSALDSEDHKKAASLNATLAHEAFQRSYNTLKAWESLRDPESALVPRDFKKHKNIWVARDNAADLFPFLLIASKLLDQESETLWLKTLTKEREICGSMPCAVQLSTRKVGNQELHDRIFGASEYAKDGLLAVSERFGQGPWFNRIEEVMKSIMDAATIKTEHGKIASQSSEVNGEMLQVLSRLYWATGNLAYIEMAENIADAYFFEILPNNHSLPPAEWNFIQKEPESEQVRLRDHGSEIIPGLVELYFLEKLKGREKAERYQKEVKKLLDHILTVGRTQKGLWYNHVDNKTEQPLDNRIVDTWGYILNSYKMFDIAGGTEHYTDEILRTMKAAASLKSYTWEGLHHDGYADSIESMLYLLPWFDIPECSLWTDEEIGIMFNMQHPSGFIAGTYLDGNFIRTALLYASYKTQGTMISPWRNDIKLGASYDKQNKDLYVYLNAESEWEGRLAFDTARHKIIWNLPLNYPRLNATPEWYVVEHERLYTVVNLDNGETSIYTGKIMAEGIPITLNDIHPSLLLKISLDPPPKEDCKTE